MKITHYLHDLSVFPLSFSFRPASDRHGQDFSLLRAPIVFVPGLGCHRNWFDSAFAHPQLRGHTLLALDLPGQGDAPDNHLARGHRHGNLMTMFAGCIQGALDMVAAIDEHDRIHVVAHSMGAIPALAAWRSLPDFRRGRFISIEGNMTGEDCTLVSRTMARGTDAVAEIIAKFAADGTPAERRWAADLAACDPEFLVSLATSVVEACDNEHDHARYGMKDTVYLYGERSGFPEHHRERFAKLGIIEQDIEGSGHFPMHDNPDELWDIIASAVGGYRGSRY